MSRNPSGEVNLSAVVPMEESGANLASNQNEEDIFNQKNPADYADDKKTDPRIKEPTSATEAPPLSPENDYVVETFFNELNKAEQAEHEKGVEKIYEKWMEDGEKLSKAFEKFSKRTIDQFEQHLDRRQKIMEDIAKKREAAEAKKVVDAYKEDMRAALRNLGVSRDHVLASMVEAHLGGVSAENVPQTSTTPETSTPLPERTAFEAPKEAGLVQTLEARLDHLSSEADKYPRFSPEREEAMKEMKQIRRELQTIERERNSAKNLKGRLEKARTAAKELGTEEAQGLKTELEAAKVALAEAESGLSEKEEALTKAEQTLADMRAKLTAAEAAPRPARGEPKTFDDDPEYNQVLNDLALEYLKTEDKAWFDRNFNGERNDEGRLLDANGNPTPFLPINNITGALDAIQAKAQAAFETTHPDKAANYKTWAGDTPKALKKKVKEAHKAMLGARDALRDGQKNIESLRTDTEQKAEAYQAVAPNLDAAQERAEKLEEEAKAARERKGSDNDAIVQVGKRERKRQEREAEEAQRKLEEDPFADALKEPGSVEKKPALDPDDPFKAAVVEKSERDRKRERVEKQNREREINTIKLDYQFLMGQEKAAEKMLASSDPVEMSIGRQAITDLAKKRDQLSSRLRELGGGFSTAEIKRLKPRPLSRAERKRWETKYGPKEVMNESGEKPLEIEGAPIDSEAQEIAQREFAEGLDKAEREAQAAREVKLKAMRRNSNKQLERKLNEIVTRISEALVPDNEDVEKLDLIQSVLLERSDKKGPDLTDEEIRRDLPSIASTKPLTLDERDALVRELQNLSLEEYTKRAKEDLHFLDADPENPGLRARADIYKQEMQRRAEIDDTKGNLSSKMKRRFEGVAHVREQVSDESSVVDAIDTKESQQEQQDVLPGDIRTREDAQDVYIGSLVTALLTADSRDPRKEIMGEVLKERLGNSDDANRELAVAEAKNDKQTVDTLKAFFKINPPKETSPVEMGGKRKVVESTNLPNKDETAHMTEDGSVEFKDAETRAKEEAEAKLKKAEADLAAEVEAHRVKAEARRAKEAEEAASKTQEEDPDAVTESEPGAREAAEALFSNLDKATPEAEEAPGKSTAEAKADAEALFSNLGEDTSAEATEPTEAQEPETQKETSEEILKAAADLTIKELVDLIKEQQTKSSEKADPEGMALIADLENLVKKRTGTPDKIRNEIQQETDPQTIAFLENFLKTVEPDKTGGATAA